MGAANAQAGAGGHGGAGANAAADAKASAGAGGMGGGGDASANAQASASAMAQCPENYQFLNNAVAQACLCQRWCRCLSLNKQIKCRKWFLFFFCDPSFR